MRQLLFGRGFGRLANAVVELFRTGQLGIDLAHGFHHGGGDGINAADAAVGLKQVGDGLLAGPASWIRRKPSRSISPRGEWI